MKSAPSGRVIGFDVDAEAIESARMRLAQFGDRVTFINDNAANLQSRLRDSGISRLNGMLMDLGVSSHQIDAPGRGFSFQQDARLDLRMDRRGSPDGWTVVNTYPQDRLAEVIWTYGEERMAGRIARRIVAQREKEPIDTTARLAAIVRSTVRGINPQQALARVFQAIRIEVNRELSNLRAALEGCLEFLAPGGRIVVISYHSLEDRVVKEFFREESRTSIPSGTKLLPDRPAAPRLNILTRKPVVPAESEIELNSRSRSAKLRAAERV
jgi:16S rRNA (cytosine1402-N4)-methyltransferase